MRTAEGAEVVLTSESVAVAKLKETHKEEYNFYVEHARNNDVEDGKDLPCFPVKLKMFSLYYLFKPSAILPIEGGV